MPTAAGPLVQTRTPGVHPAAGGTRMPNVVALPRRPGSNAHEAERSADVRPDERRHRMSASAARQTAGRRPAADVVPLRTLAAPADGEIGAHAVGAHAVGEHGGQHGEQHSGQDHDTLNREFASDDLFDSGNGYADEGPADAEAEFEAEDRGAPARACQTSPAAQATRAAALAPADDAQLAHWIERIARQEERALRSLYDATSARVHGVVLRLTQRAALAEEVLEDTYWQVWRQAPRFDAARGRPITWLLAMARSRAIDALRREQRFQHEELPDDDLAEAGTAAGDSTTAGAPPPDLLEATRGHAQVHAALASLEPRSRQLVALAFFRGLTHEEIAAQQDMPLGTVKSLIRRALQQLRRVMEAEHA